MAAFVLKAFAHLSFKGPQALFIFHYALFIKQLPFLSLESGFKPREKREKKNIFESQSQDPESKCQTIRTKSTQKLGEERKKYDET